MISGNLHPYGVNAGQEKACQKTRAINNEAISIGYNQAEITKCCQHSADQKNQCWTMSVCKSKNRKDKCATDKSQLNSRGQMTQRSCRQIEINDEVMKDSVAGKP